MGVLALVAEATDFGQNTVHGLTLDELHRVVADPVLRAVVKDADDVRMVQPGRQAGLGVEPSQVVRVGPESRANDLQRHPALERLMLGFVNHTHPPAADPAVECLLELSLPLGADRHFACPRVPAQKLRRKRPEVAAGNASLSIETSRPASRALVPSCWRCTSCNR